MYSACPSVSKSGHFLKLSNAAVPSARRKRTLNFSNRVSLLGSKFRGLVCHLISFVFGSRFHTGSVSIEGISFLRACAEGSPRRRQVKVETLRMMKAKILAARCTTYGLER